MKMAWIVVMAGLCMAGSVWAAANPFGVADSFSGAATSTVPVEVNAPMLDLAEGGKVMILSGGVTITRGEETLQADTVAINKVTQMAEAKGNVVFTRQEPATLTPATAPQALTGRAAGVPQTRRPPALVWRGDTFQYNLQTGEWKTGAFDSYFDPFHVSAKDSRKDGDAYVLRNAVMTTCTNAPGHYHFTMSCRRARVYPGDHFTVRHMTLRLGRVPVFYFPWWYRSLSDRAVGFSIEAGYRDRMGAFLLTTTKYWMAPTLKGATEVDYRTERGPGVGQELGWRLKHEAGNGRLYGYYAPDQGADKDYGDGREAVDSQRYRLSFSHGQTLSPRDYFLSDLTYLSDRYLLEDFFEKEYRDGFQPQNYAMTLHRGDAYSMSLSAYKRLNDFYEAVDRLPEAAVDVQRLQIADSPFYYESRNSAAFLQKLYPEEDGEAAEEEYSAARVDTAHRVYYPTRHFGFLNLIPRAGYRGTYYSETVERSIVTQAVTVVTTNLPAGSTTPVVSSRVETNEVTTLNPAGSDLRSLFELGMETSFRAFKVLNNDPNLFGVGVRHVVEPYANYTFSPEPNLTPDRLYRFDEIDELDSRNDVRFGLRNRWQTKRSGRVSDVADVDVFTTYSFEERDEDEPFSTVGMESEFNLADWCQIYLDGQYDLYDDGLEELNGRIRLSGGSWRGDIEQRYLLDESNLLITDLAYAPNKGWEFGLYDRFEFEDSRLEEQGVFVTRTLDCLAFRVGGSYLPGYTRDDGTEREDDYRATFQMWLTAFPNVRLGSSRRD
jgi:lipopolysaccharide assembly outer membrane protein LptD (OstA)